MDNLSLYDVLVGCFISDGVDPGDVDESYFDQWTEDEKLRKSIVENLKLVLQTRKGSVLHLPDFGIPDIRQIYFDEGTIDSVPNQIRETILKYEPRLSDVKVKKKDFDEKNLRITLEISAKIKEVPGKEVIFTEFSSTGWTKVIFDRDMKKEKPMSEVKYFEREYNYLQEAGEEFSKKHQAIGGMLRITEKQRKDPFVERLLEAFAFLSGRIHERLDDDMPEFTGGLLEQLFPHFLRPFPSCAILEAKPMTGSVTKSVLLNRGSEIQTPTGKYKIKYRVTASPLDKERVLEKTEPAEFIFRTTRDLDIRPMRLKNTRVDVDPDGNSVLILQIQPDRNVDFESLNMKKLSLYLHGAYRLKFTLLLYLTEYVSSIEIREIGSARDTFQKIDHVQIGIPGLSEGLDNHEDDDALVPFARQIFRGYRLLQEYFSYPERFFFVDVIGLDAFESSGDGNPFEIKFKFDRKLSTELAPSIKDIFINCVPIVNLFDRDVEEVQVTQRLPEYNIIPDIDRRKSKEIYSVNEVTGISENKLMQYTYTPVTSYDILDNKDPEYDYKRFYSTVYRPSPGDVADHVIRLFGSSMEEDVFPKETLSIIATMSNGILPSKYLQINSITEPINFPEGIQASNISVPSEVLPYPDRKNFLWVLIAHLSMSYTTLADTDTLKTILSLYNWSPAQTNPNKKKINEGIVKVYPPETKYIHRHRNLIRGIEFKIDIESEKFENGEGDIHLFGMVMSTFLRQYITINSFIILTIVDIKTGKNYTWKPNSGKILPV